MTGIATHVYRNRFNIRERETSELNLRETRNCHEDLSYLLN